jgi:hypothetical protein
MHFLPWTPGRTSCEMQNCFPLAFTAHIVMHGGLGDVQNEFSKHQTESVLAGLGQLVDEAKLGNADVLPEIRRILDQYPEIWRHYGDLAKHTENK